jgi:hypothetical protein
MLTLRPSLALIHSWSRTCRPRGVSWPRLDIITRSADDADQVLPVYAGFDHLLIAVVRRARRVARNLAECHAATVHWSVACRKCSFGGVWGRLDTLRGPCWTYLCRPPMDYGQPDGLHIGPGGWMRPATAPGSVGPHMSADMGSVLARGCRECVASAFVLRRARGAKALLIKAAPSTGLSVLRAGPASFRVPAPEMRMRRLAPCLAHDVQAVA